MDDAIRMNETSGRKLFELCQPYTNFMMTGMDFGDFIEEVCIPIDRLNQYFNGQRNMYEEDLARFAHVCRMSRDALAACLRDAYQEQIRKEREQKELEEQIKQREEERKRQQERKAVLEVKTAEILAELEKYGIDRIYEDSKEYSIEEYYPLKFIMRYLRKEEYLPKLKVLLGTCTDEALVYGESHALIWAADSDLSYRIMLMLAGRREFIERYIGKTVYGGQTALHRYVSSRTANPDGIDLLVRWGADVNAKDDFLWTPLHDAENRQNDELAGRLLRLGAKSSPDKDGRTPGDIRFRLDALDAW